MLKSSLIAGFLSKKEYAANAERMVIEKLNTTALTLFIRGKVGDYVDIINSFKVFPVLNVRITKTIF